MLEKKRVRTKAKNEKSVPKYIQSSKFIAEQNKQAGREELLKAGSKGEQGKGGRGSGRM